MNAILVLLVSCAILFIGYITYGSWLAKQWGVEPNRKTPAHTMSDGVDYVPAKAPVLLGHHFSSIAGAGPINGPIQAAIFGWLPVLLWILIGGIFFGAVQDFASLFASIRHGGKSIGEIIGETLGTKGKRIFTVFGWLVLLLVVAAFADIVAGTFNGFPVVKDVVTPNANNGSVATASMLFIALAVVFGFLVYRRNFSLAIASVIGVVLIGVIIALGLAFPIMLDKNTWLLILFAYIFIASVTPVWILLQPRDYLSSFLLYFMMIAALCAVLFTNPSMNLPAFTAWDPIPNKSSPLFPVLFITVACGAISGFHSLVGSGTSSKQLDKEGDAKLIGYGAMLIECALAVVALIAVSCLYTATTEGVMAGMPAGTPAVVLANFVSGSLAQVGLPENVIFTIITLSVSAFALTSLDTATRLGRFMFQEFFTDPGKEATGIAKILSDKYVSTIITVIVAGVMAIAGYQNIWPLFGAANQLLAALSLLAVALWLNSIGKNYKMFLFPTAFMLVATLTSLCISFYNNAMAFVNGTGSIIKEGSQCFIIVLLLVLAVMLTFEGVKKLMEKSKKLSA